MFDHHRGVKKAKNSGSVDWGGWKFGTCNFDVHLNATPLILLLLVIELVHTSKSRRNTSKRAKKLEFRVMSHLELEGEGWYL